MVLFVVEFVLLLLLRPCAPSLGDAGGVPRALLEGDDEADDAAEVDCEEEDDDDGGNAVDGGGC